MTNNNDELDKIDFMITVQHYQPPLQEHQITEMRIRLEDKAKQALINWRDKQVRAKLQEASDMFDDMHQKTEGGGFVHYGEFGEWLDEQLKELSNNETQD